MRVLQKLAFAAVAAQAEFYEDDNADLAFLRQLQGNNTPANTTAAPATQAPNTTAAPANTTAAPATQAPATQAPNTTAAPANTTAAPATQAPATQAPATQAPAAGANTSAPAVANALNTDPPAVAKNLTENATNETQTITIVAKITGITPPVTVPTASSRLRRLNAVTTKAYNLWCSSFSLTSALVACETLQGQTQIPAGATTDNAGYQAGTFLFPSMEHCVAKIDKQIAGGNCHQTGICIDNGASTNMPENKACTKHIANGNLYDYETTQSFKMNKAAYDAVAPAVTAAKTAAQSAMDDPATTTKLELYMVAAAVQMSEDPQIAAAVNFTTAFGMDAAALASAKTVLSNGITAAVTATTPAAALTTAATAIKTTNPTMSAMSIADTTPAATTGTTGTTSGAMMVGVFSSMALVFASLFF